VRHDHPIIIVLAWLVLLVGTFTLPVAAWFLIDPTTAWQKIATFTLSIPLALIGLCCTATLARRRSGDE